MHQYVVSIFSLNKTNDVVLSYLHALVAMRLKLSKLRQKSEASLFNVVQDAITKHLAILILTACYEYLTITEGSE